MLRGDNQQSIAKGQIRCIRVMLMLALILALMPVKSTVVNASSIPSYTNGKWVTSGGKRYYYDSKHKKVTGWARIEGTYYYIDSNGAKNGWIKKNNKTYYCSSNKGKLYGWKEISGKKYYFLKGSYIAKDKWIAHGKQWWYVNKKGVMERKADKNSGTKKGYKKIIMVGDSRMARTKKAGITAPGVQFIAEPGMGYYWLVYTAYDKIMKEIAEGGGHTAIVFNLGANDLVHINYYLNFMNRKMTNLARGEDCDLYYMSVNPVDEDKLIYYPRWYSTRKQSMINAFNKKLKAGLNPSYKYIDMSSYLLKTYTTSEITVEDGLHYTKDTSRVILDKCVDYLKKGKL